MSDSWFLIDDLKRFCELACAKAKYTPCAHSKHKEDFYFYNYRSESHTYFSCTIASGNFSSYDQRRQLSDFQSWFPGDKPEMRRKTSHEDEDVQAGAVNMIRLCLIVRKFIEEVISSAEGDLKTGLYWASPWHFGFCLQGHVSVFYERREENLLAIYERLRLEIEPHVRDSIKRRFIDVRYSNGRVISETFYPSTERL